MSNLVSVGLKTTFSKLIYKQQHTLHSEHSRSVYFRGSPDFSLKGPKYCKNLSKGPGPNTILELQILSEILLCFMIKLAASAVFLYLTYLFLALALGEHLIHAQAAKAHGHFIH